MALEGFAEWNTSALLVHRQFSVLGAVGRDLTKAVLWGLGIRRESCLTHFVVMGYTGKEAVGPALLCWPLCTV